MNRSCVFAAGLALALCSVGRSSPDFTDTFSGSSLDTTRWTPSSPYSDSSVAVSGGDLVLTNRGRVLTNDGFPNPHEISFRFAFTGNVYDSFKVSLRTDGLTTNSSQEFDRGVVASFRIQSDPSDPAGTNNNITLYSENYPVSQTLLGQGTFALTLNQFYDVRLVDSGTSVSLFMNNGATPFLTGVTSDSYGQQIGIDNREGGGGGSWISNGSEVKLDYFSVKPVPDSGSTILLLLLGCGATWVLGTFVTGMHRSQNCQSKGVV